jgi:hypothetical protein
MLVITIFTVTVLIICTLHEFEVRMKKSVTEDELGFLTRTRLCRVPAETVHPR